MPLELLGSALEPMGFARVAPDKPMREDELEVVPLLRLGSCSGIFNVAWLTRLGRADEAAALAREAVVSRSRPNPTPTGSTDARTGRAPNQRRCMMPLSQIDMVVLEQDGSSLEVCGGLERGDGKVPGRSARLYVVVRQGDVIATGEGICKDDGSKRWQVDVKVPEDLTAQPLKPGPAMACGVAIVEEAPAGLEAFSWAQQVEILPSGAERPKENPIPFPDPELAVSARGQLATDRTVSSSLTVKPSESSRTHRWTHEADLRKVVPAPFTSPHASQVEAD